MFLSFIAITYTIFLFISILFASKSSKLSRSYPKLAPDIKNGLVIAVVNSNSWFTGETMAQGFFSREIDMIERFIFFRNPQIKL